MKEKTPIETYIFAGGIIDVKREDLCGGKDFPPLAKLRGIIKFVERLKARGIKTFGVMDTRVSKAGWGLSAIGKLLDVEVICFYPRLKKEDELPIIQKKEKENGARVVGLPACRTQVMYKTAKNETERHGGYMLPMGLTLPETVEETKKQAQKLPKEYGSIVVCVGTGTIMAGLIKAFFKTEHKPKIHGISCGMSNEKQKARIKKLLGIIELPPYALLHEPEYDYYDKAISHPPFDSCPYYDAKAWEWLLKNYADLKKPVLFWNIGGETK